MPQKKPQQGKDIVFPPSAFPERVSAAQGISRHCCGLSAQLPSVELCFTGICPIFPLTLVDFLHPQHPSGRTSLDPLLLRRNHLPLLLLERGSESSLGDGEQLLPFWFLLVIWDFVALCHPLPSCFFLTYLQVPCKCMGT